jgi:beta-galactosidase
VGYFRWRTCSFGTEIYWHGILNYDNRDTRRLREVGETHRDIQRLQEVCGKEYVAEVALLRDYDNEWEAAEDAWLMQIDRPSCDNIFKACQKAHVPFDMRYINDGTDAAELARYKLVFYPHPVILTEKRAAMLRAYAEQGGTVVFGCRTGYKDINGVCPMMPMPGYAAELCGATVEEFTFLNPYDEKQTADGVSAPVFNDVLEVTDGEVLATFDTNYYAGKPALVRKALGKGRVYYFGATFAEDNVLSLLKREHISTPCGLGEALELPESVELAVRGEYAFLLNYEPTPVEIPCKADFDELLGGDAVGDRLCLPAYGVAVLKRRLR